MNDETEYTDCYIWERNENNTYTQLLRISMKDGRSMDTIIRENVSEKEYFLYKLDGTA